MNRFISKKHKDISPEEIFLDSENVPNWNTGRLEGVIETPIRNLNLVILLVMVLLVSSLLVYQLYILQIKDGKTNYAQSEKNRLDKVPLFSERGVIYDRNKVELAWNVKDQISNDFSLRSYIGKPGFGFLGFVRYPQKDSSGKYWRTEISGESGFEKSLNTKLSGITGTKVIEVDAFSNIQSENTYLLPKPGENIVLTIDSKVQTQLYRALWQHANDYHYAGGAGVIMDVTNGEIIAMVSYPDTDSNVFVHSDEEENKKIINNYLKDPRKPFLNRVVSGLYTPGSIVKPYMALAGLEKGVITKSTIVHSTGAIEVPNPYDKEHPYKYRDWKVGGHGYVNLEEALANSVNTFFYSIGGGYGSITGIGIRAVNEVMKRFGIGELSGIEIEGEVQGLVPSPEWKKKVFNESWRLGDTYISSIGQFGFQVTPIQMVRALGAMVNGGILYTPHIVQDSVIPKPKDLGVNQGYADTIKSGMRLAVTDGTAYPLNIKEVKIASKTGTAQVGAHLEKVNSWVTGFFPYDNPKYAFVVVMEGGPKDVPAASWAMRHFLDTVIKEGDSILIPGLKPQKDELQIEPDTKTPEINVEQPL